MKLTRILLVLLAFFLIASFPLNRKSNSYNAQAQSSGAPPTGAPAAAQPGTSDPPGTIDGAKNPELIPDDVANRLVLLAIAEPGNATDEQKARLRAKIGPAGLGEDDIQMLVGILGTFQDQMDGLTAQANQIRARNPIPLAGTPDYLSLIELSKQREPIFNQAMSALPARLSADGAAKLLAHIQNAKRGMKYLPENPTP